MKVRPYLSWVFLRRSPNSTLPSAQSPRSAFFWLCRASALFVLRHISHFLASPKAGKFSLSHRVLLCFISCGTAITSFHSVRPSLGFRRSLAQGIRNIRCPSICFPPTSCGHCRFVPLSPRRVAFPEFFSLVLEGANNSPSMSRDPRYNVTVALLPPALRLPGLFWSVSSLPLYSSLFGEAAGCLTCD